MQRWCASWGMAGGEFCCLSVCPFCCRSVAVAAPSLRLCGFVFLAATAAPLFSRVATRITLPLVLAVTHAVLLAAIARFSYGRYLLRDGSAMTRRTVSVCRLCVSSARCSPRGDQLVDFLVTVCHSADGTFPSPA
jgi:hypothetical protein